LGRTHSGTIPFRPIQLSSGSRQAENSYRAWPLGPFWRRKNTRSLIIDSIISLDGYFTSLRNEIDWFGFDDEEWAWSRDINRSVDTMLYGRVTYEEFRQFWPTGAPKSIGADPVLIRQLNTLQKVVFSRTLTKA